jgi:hypothetical protein
MSSVSRDLEIPYTSEDFPSGLFHSYGRLRTSWSELLWAAITIGRPNVACVFEHSEASLHEAVFRASLVRMALERGLWSGHLCRTDAFRALDPTEKGAVSYFLGMAVCKLFASRLLCTPWLLHLDVFRSQLNPSVLGGRSRPDLVGQDNRGRWHAFESKGRSGAPNAEDKRKAKAQAQRLVSVNGFACSLHVGSFAFFRNDLLEFYWRDPEPEEPEKLDPIGIEVGESDWAYYYAPALALITQEGETTLGPSLNDLDLSIDVHPNIRGPLLSGDWHKAHKLAIEMARVLQEEGFQPDGLKVIAGKSWGEPRPSLRRS